MRLCFLTGEYPPMQGGVADHTAHLARQLSDLGVEVLVLTSHKAAGAAPDRPGRDPRVVVYPTVGSWGFSCWRHIGRFLAEQRPDVLHIQYQAAAYDLAGWVNLLPWRLRRQRNRPRLVVTFHDLRVPYLFSKAGPLRWRAILWLARYADGVIVTNAEDAQTLHRYPWSGHVQLVPLGSNVEPAPPPGYERLAWRRRLGIADDELLLAYFGFLNQSKGGETLVLALDQLRQRNCPASLLMIGGQVGDVDPSNQAYAERVRQLIHARGLGERVHWTGFVSPDEVSAHLLAADAVVMPYQDGVSFRRTTLIAALRHGCPVVTTQPAVPLPELRDGENVLLVRAGDPGALAEALSRLAGDAELRARLAAGALELGRGFDWSHVTQQTLAVYRRVMGG